MRPHEPLRQVLIASDVQAPDPLGCWIGGASGFLRHIEGATGGDGRMIRDQILHPQIFEHIGDVSGKRVFDAGGGEGILSRELIARGANVIGGDYVSAFLQEAANATPSTPSVRLNLIKPLPFASESFDVVVSNLVLQWLPDIDGLVGEIFRVTKPGGKFVLSVSHPIINLGRFDVTNQKKPIFILENSLQEARWLKMINMSNGPYIYYQRPPSAYVNILTGGGFQLAAGKGYDEVFFPESFIQEHPEYLKHQWYPLFLILEAVKRC